MSKNGKDRRPGMSRIQNFQLSEKHIKLRWILVAILLGIAIVSFGVGFSSALNTEPGWQQVEVNTSDLNCGQDFVLMYEFGVDGVSATAEYKNVVSLYSNLVVRAYRLFTANSEAEEHNVWFLNRHLNEEVSVPAELYDALELVNRYESRDPFLAPAVNMYHSVFLAENDGEAALYDPMRSDEQMGYVREAAGFASDPAHISVELMGDRKVRLNVSQAYLTYAQENGIETFLDFGWMKNAFIADFLAESLANAGYTNGYLASFDGFTRNLDSRNQDYSFNLFDRLDNTITIPAVLSYQGPSAIVFLRNYPLTEQDRWHYYAYQDGGVTSVYLDEKGVSRSSTDNLVSYSRQLGCVEILLQTAPVFLTQQLEEARLIALAQAGIHSVWGEGSQLRYTDGGAVALLPEFEEQYQLNCLSNPE